MGDIRVNPAPAENDRVQPHEMFKYIVAYIAIASVGCATLLSDNYKTVVVRSRGPITLDGAPAGVGPTTFTVSAHTSHTIVVGDRSCQLDTSVGGGWIILDVLFTGLIVGLVIDAVTGEWSTVDPSACAL